MNKYKESAIHKYIIGIVWGILALIVGMLIITTYDKVVSHVAMMEILKKGQDMEYGLDILSKSDGILSANGITYLVTLIVALLAALVLNRIGEMEDLVAKNKQLEENAVVFYNHSARYNHILTRVESLFYIAIIIDDVLTTLRARQNGKTNEENPSDPVLKEIGVLSSRLSITMSQLENLMNDRQEGIDFFTPGEKSLLLSYLDDTAGQIEKAKGLSKQYGQHISGILGDKYRKIMQLKSLIRKVEIRDIL